METTRPALIQSLRLQNFRSVRDATVHFDNPLFLVGRNGSGKSNIVDALRLLSEAMSNPFAELIRRRISIMYSHRELSQPERLQKKLSIEIEFKSLDWQGKYKILLGRIWPNSIIVEGEEASIEFQNGGHYYFKREDSQVATNVIGLAPVISHSSLMLPLISGLSQFRPLFDAIATIRVYDFDIKKIREVQAPDEDDLLKANGANLAHILELLPVEQSELINIYLGRLLGTKTEAKTLLAYSIGEYPSDGSRIVAMQQQREDNFFTVFTAHAMSDGTLRALAVLTAALQQNTPSCMVIEEPESGLHPGAMNILADVIQEASERTQVVITTHSPDLIDAKWIQPENLRVVSWEKDATQVLNLGPMATGAIRQHLMYAGQLMRANALDTEIPTETLNGVAPIR